MERKFLGVCVWIAKKTNIEVTWIRVGFVVATILGCTALLNSPGTLGGSSSHEFNCPSTDINYAINNVLDLKEFKIDEADSSIVQWWKDGGYDFLNYKCLKIKKRIYMLTINSNSNTDTELGIRSYYSRKKNEWIFATEFTNDDSYRADKALEHLLTFLPTCD